MGVEGFACMEKKASAAWRTQTDGRPGNNDLSLDHVIDMTDLVVRLIEGMFSHGFVQFDVNLAQFTLLWHTGFKSYCGSDYIWDVTLTRNMRNLAIHIPVYMITTVARSVIVSSTSTMSLDIWGSTQFFIFIYFLPLNLKLQTPNERESGSFFYFNPVSFVFISS